MKKEITRLLANIEKSHQVEILYACESGSRAWGFASPNSDYDIRFLYRSEKSHYLSVFEEKDTIEIPIANDLDPGGWDIRKALALLGKSNGALIEWLHSPIVYLDIEGFQKQWRNLTREVFNPSYLSNHYYGLANQIYREKLSGNNKPSAKSYLYACRALLVKLWIEQKKEPPTVPFIELLPTGSAEIKKCLENLVNWKATADETASQGRISLLDRFIEDNLQSTEDSPTQQLHSNETKRKALNREFLRLFEKSKCCKTNVHPIFRKLQDFTLEQIRRPELCLLNTIGGSHAYGTQTEHSDQDYRGIFVAPMQFLSGLETIEQVTDEKTTRSTTKSDAFSSS